MAKNIEKTQSDSARLHEEILELAKEHSDIIEHADDYRERWQTVFPDGMLEELCVEFQCCPALVLIALETIDVVDSSELQKIKVRISHNDTDIITNSIMDATRWLRAANVINGKELSPREVSKCAHSNGRFGDYTLSIANMVSCIFKAIQRHLLHQIGIYKINCLITHQNYIGQTRVNFLTRWKEHIRNSTRLDYLLYKAIRQYGIENFSFSIVEIIENPSSAVLNEREKKWIREYKAFSFDGGLNESKPKNSGSIINDSILDLIYDELLAGATNEQIARKTGISSSTISDIRQGKRHQRREIKYPIKNTYTSNSQLHLDIAWHIINTNNSFHELSQLFNVSESMISAVNNGYHKILKETYDKQDFPLRKRCTVKNVPSDFDTPREIISLDDIISRESLLDLLQNHSFKEIGSMYDVSDAAIRRLAKKKNLPYHERERKQFSKYDWESEIWLEPEYKYQYSNSDHADIVTDYLRTRSIQYVRQKYSIKKQRINYILKKYNLPTLHTIDYFNSCTWLEEPDLYFRTSYECAEYLKQNYSMNFAHSTIENHAKANKLLCGLNIASISEESFFGLVEKRLFISYLYDEQWRTLIEDPSILPDFILLDDLPWVAEFKKFYGME